MASTTLLCLNRSILNKCFLTKLKCCKHNFYTTAIHRGLRSSRKFNRNFKNTNVEIVQPLGPARRDIKVLWNNFCFTVGLGGAVLVGAIIWEYESMSKTFKKSNFYKHFQFQRQGFRGKCQDFWNKLSVGQKLFVPILLINVAVYAGWRIPALESLMRRYFTISINSSTSWSLLFSMFSHCTILHMTVNMIVLHSFCEQIVSRLGKEQFISLYLTSGLVSGLFSQIYRFILRCPGSSIGASGAIMGLVGFMCCEFPDLRLIPMVFPFVTVRAETAFYLVSIFEATGLIRRWQYLDHAAHMSGLMFGWAWHAWIRENVWYKRGVVTDMWHKIRSRSPPV